MSTLIFIILQPLLWIIIDIMARKGAEAGEKSEDCNSQIIYNRVAYLFRLIPLISVIP